MKLLSLWQKILTLLKSRFGQIFSIHLVYVALGLVLFTPLLGAVGRLLLKFSGQSVLSDLDIAYFLLSPTGLLALLLFGALLITILVFEQASLMAVCGAALQGQQLSLLAALAHTARYIKNLFLFSIRLVLRILLITLPFLALSALIAWFLITDYDINYYLAEKPPEFLIAASVIGLVLLAMLVILLRKLLSWSLTLPLILFSDVSPSRSFAESSVLVQNHRRAVLLALGSWGLLALLLEIIALGALQLLGSTAAPLFFHSTTWLLPGLSALVLLYSLANLLITTFNAGSFAALLITLHVHFGAEIEIDGLAAIQQTEKRRLSAPAFALILAGAVIAALLIGRFLVKGIPTDNNSMIIAHRGAAGKAPENTMASISQAIEDGTDWVEIDVQETSDGRIVVVHDSDFMKLAAVDLKVWNGSLQEIQKIDVGSWFAAKFAQERVPTLTEVLEEARGKARVLIELKYYGHDQQLEQRVVDIVEQAGMVDDVAIMSLKYEGIKKFHALRPDWEIGLLSTKAIGNLSKLEVDFMAINMATAKPAFIRRIHATGKEVYVWTVNDQVSLSRMIALGVDGLITDEPALARDVLNRQADMSPAEHLLLHTAVLFGKVIPQRTYRDQSP
ncbi:MAG: glycerophosphodiester phosphodiesterase [Thermodesulfobacteriota bacterium]